MSKQDQDNQGKYLFCKYLPPPTMSGLDRGGKEPWPSSEYMYMQSICDPHLNTPAVKKEHIKELCR